MLSWLAKYLFSASSAAPVCITFAVMAWFKGELALTWMMISFALIITFLFLYVFIHIKNELSQTTLSINSVSSANKEITNYFLAYLFPIIGADSIISDWRIAIFFYLCFFFYLSFSSSYHFNPLLFLMGYKIYEATDPTGRGIVILSKEEIRKGNLKNMVVKEITPYMYLIEKINYE
ncbi:TPA: hypothetical protein ACY37E_000541 [Pasteurella multocida]|uniref:hypothetical protein n=2 Tax=Pasteurella multocida TaxID=747 RepID=UPI00064CAB87|nr:hypothetical protein [Pasteurella multocida]KLT48605.1 hypothetical protein PVACC_02445 [Pasteurella multocida subsp. multocida]KLT52921.1 hypothetical protein PMMV1_02445 [Pasteurella multocida subsp. multocida]KLT58284.1 hypothetical protein ISLM_02440 [Pasteurella multocida subsp. multocida]KLT62924.1 hypothetical protein PESH_02445 [Pasteurella multocida subsp. multocida]KLU28302.1 hypothetical protein ATTK_11095 [Pasteurella multocida subsp. multocida]